MINKRSFLIAMVLIAASCFFILLFSLPPEVAEPRAESNYWFFIAKIIFLSVSASVTLSLLLLVFIRRSYFRQQANVFFRFRHLLLLLVKRDFVSRYRRSVLGVLWSLLNPLLNMVVMTIVFSYIFRFNIPNFPVYLLSGQIIFGFFAESTGQAMGSVIGSAGIVTRVYVPKYIFPFSRVISSLVNLFFSFCAFLLVAVITRAPFHWTIFLIPVPIIYTFVFSLGIGLILSSLVVFFRDLNYLYGVFVSLLSYLTPLFYPVNVLPEWVQSLLGLNPLYHFVDYFRCLALYGTIPDLWSNIVCMGFSMAAICCGLYIFIAQQDKYILYM